MGDRLQLKLFCPYPPCCPGPGGPGSRRAPPQAAQLLTLLIDVETLVLWGQLSGAQEGDAKLNWMNGVLGPWCSSGCSLGKHSCFSTSPDEGKGTQEGAMTF